MLRLGTIACSTAILLILLLISSAPSVLGHSASARNLRLSRVGNRIVASWSHPAGVDSATYLVRRTLRYAGEGWTGWSSSNSVTGTSSTVHTGITADAVDIRVIVELLAHGSVHSAASASLCGVSTSTSGSSCGGGGGSGRRSLRPLATARPKVHTCQTLSDASNRITVSSSAGLESGIQCQQLNGAGIGISSIVEAGFTSAVDVWGLVRDARVCFEFASGSMLFLDAANSPRTAAPIASSTEDSSICATIDRPGSLVLVPSSGALPLEPTQPAESTRPTVQIAPATRGLFGCQITTTTFVSFRDSPGGPNVLFYVHPGVTMYAFDREGDWFRVRLQNADGWISALYAVSEGLCG